VKFIRRWLLRLLLAGLLLTVLLVLPMRWIDPPTSAFMLRDRLINQRSIDFRPVERHKISRHLFLAVVAAEDQNFPHHRGFDTREIRRALDVYQQTGRLRGASTITQQLAKNLYLWPGQSWFRKSLEAWFTIWLEICLPKRRILGLYLNIAEFDAGVYGAQAAAMEYSGQPAHALTPAQSALLAAVLPAPKRFDAATPNTYILKRQKWILEQMQNLGQGWLP